MASNFSPLRSHFLNYIFFVIAAVFLYFSKSIDGNPLKLKTPMEEIDDCTEVKEGFTHRSTCSKSFSDELYITRLTIINDFPQSPGVPYNLTIRIGNTNVSGLSNKPEEYEKNPLCKATRINTKYSKFKINCDEPLVGKVFILEKKVICEYNDLTTHNFLCNFFAYGYNMNELEEDRIDFDKQTIVVNQKSTASDGLASLATISKDDNKISNFYAITTDKPCAAIHDYKHFRVYLLQLNDVYEINEITFKSTGKFSEDFIIEAFVENEGNQHLQENSIYKIGNCGVFIGLLKNTNTIKCKEILFGNTIKLQISRACEIDDRFQCKDESFSYGIYQCDIEAKGYPVPNVAARRNAKQSRTLHGGIPSLANDQQISDIFSHNARPACTYAEEKDNYPWWRVDLNGEYLVNSLLIFSDVYKYGNLHDVDIRIGFTDIYKFYYTPRYITNKYTARFEENFLCKRFSNKTLLPGGNFITCDHPLIGRYVSIQIMNNCSLKECLSEKNTNVLSLCEVEVYGFPVDHYYYGDLALGKNVKNGEMNLKNFAQFTKNHIFGEDLTRSYHQRDLNWWYLDLEDVHVVNAVDLLTGIRKKSSTGSTHIEVLVGFQNLFEDESFPYEHFHSTVSCFDNNVEINLVTSAKCMTPVIGRYVTVLSVGKCYPAEACDYKSILTIKHIQVWGTKIRKRYLDTTTNFAIDWSMGLSIISDRRNLGTIQILKRQPQCTLTSTTDKYPWWQADFFLRKVLIMSVSIWNTNDDFNDLLHDIEIRVGQADESSEEDKPFSKNPLCYKNDTIVPKGKSTFDCMRPLFGRYMTIQIVTDCYTYQCHSNLYNVLSLCKVDVKGYYIDTPNKKEHRVVGNDKWWIQDE